MRKLQKTSIPLHAIAAEDLKAWAVRYPFLKAAGFTAKEGEVRLLPDRKGGVAAWVLGLGKNRDSLALAAFSEFLPDGTYRLGEVPDWCGGAQAALAWALGTYSFDRYKKPKKRAVKLVLPAGVDGAEISRSRWRRDQSHCRGRVSGPRSDQHAPQ